jgi:hypothetical protein
LVVRDRHNFQDAVKLSVLPGELPPHLQAVFCRLDDEYGHPFQRMRDDILVHASIRLGCINGNLKRASEQPPQRGGIKAARARGIGSTVIDYYDPDDGERGPFEVCARLNPSDLNALHFCFDQRKDEPKVITLAEIVKEQKPHSGGVEGPAHGRLPPLVGLVLANASIRRRHSAAASAELLHYWC